MSNKFEFDIAEFNKKFNQVMDEKKKETEKADNSKLRQLELATEKKKSPYNQTLGEIIIGIKDSIFGIIGDILDGEFDAELITKNHRLYYIGMTLIMIVLIYSLLNILSQLYIID